MHILKVVPSKPESGAVPGLLEVDAVGEAADHLAAAAAAALLLGSTSPQCSSAAAPASA